MFLDVLELIFSCMESVIDSLKVDLFSIGSVGVSFWELIFGLFVTGIIFSFFLMPRSGSVLAGVGNLARAENRESREKSRENSRLAEKEVRRSYEYYAENRSRNEEYSARYKAERHRR